MTGLAETCDRSAAPLAKTSFGKAAEVEKLIAPAVEALGYDIVRVAFSDGDRAVLQIMAERKTDGGMSVDDCAEVSRTVAAILDVEDPISGPYNLEVSSPGLDRPLTRLADFDRFANFEAKVEVGTPIDGRRRFAGRLRGVAGQDIILEGEGERWQLPFADVTKAKLRLTDELIAASQASRATSANDA